MSISENVVEDAAIEILSELGYVYAPPSEISPEGTTPARTSFGEVILEERFRDALARFNPDIPKDAQADAVRQVLAEDLPSLIEENRRLHRLITEGVDVQFQDAGGDLRSDKVWLLDFSEPSNNDWLITRQFTVIEGRHQRRPDIVLFVNGLPLGVIELKNPGDEDATIEGAYQQLQTYKQEIPSLFRTNAVLVTTDGVQARIGSLSAEVERFMPWRTVMGNEGDVEPQGSHQMDILLRGVFEPARFLQLIRDFTVFGDKGDGPFKILAGYHQFHGARKALDATIEASGPKGDRKIGVIWHTQGSGKSLLMAFFAGLVVRSKTLANPTILVVTDRNDLDDQLFTTFGLCRDLIRQTPEQADGRDDLRRLLDRASGGVIFTTVQKFSPDKDEEHFPMLSDRRNVIVIADEAHRSQYGFKSRTDKESGRRRYGYAHHIREALPNASFIGFTGTPIEASDVNTPAIFGGYVDIYDISRAVADGATVPIYYESRVARIFLNDDVKPLIDAEIEAMLEDETLSEQEKQKAKWTTVERLVGSEKRLSQVVSDMVTHLEARLDALNGKAMAVCMSRRICVDLYKAIIDIRPEWHSENDAEGMVKIVMTGAATDPDDWQQHIGGKKRRDDLAKRARDPDDPLKLVIVRDMWLTGFDAPCLHTMYIDKPMRGHGLMQAIARVNRVFKDKPGGLVVDYIGVAQNLKNALGQYTASDRGKTGIDEEAAVAAMVEQAEVVRGMLHGHDYSLGLTGSQRERLAALGNAVDWVLNWQEKEAAKLDDVEAKKRAHKRFQDAVLALGKAYALAAASDQAKSVRDEVGFFQAIRAALIKKTATGKVSKRSRSFAIEQLVNQAIADAEIVDVLKAVGLKTPNLSILSDEFLLDIQKMKQKNLALEALRKLLNGEIKSRSHSNVIEARAFSKRLEDAVARYHANALSTVEMIQELIGLAKDMKTSIARGEVVGLSPDEVAFYDALADNESAVQVMGNEQLRIIAHELLEQLRRNAPIDWQKKRTARAKMRTLVKHILKKFGYPPDLSQAAVKTVIEQAELWLRDAA